MRLELEPRNSRRNEKYDSDESGSGIVGSTSSEEKWRSRRQLSGNWRRRGSKGHKSWKNKNDKGARLVKELNETEKSGSEYEVTQRCSGMLEIGKVVAESGLRSLNTADKNHTKIFPSELICLTNHLDTSHTPKRILRSASRDSRSNLVSTCRHFSLTVTQSWFLST